MRDRQGFTLIEVVVSIVLLAVVLTALAGTAARYAHGVTTSGVRSAALQMVEDRLEEVRMHPTYDELDDFEETEEDVGGIEDATRETTVNRVQNTLTGGGVVDYTVVTVEVTRPGLARPVSRTAIVGAP